MNTKDIIAGVILVAFLSCILGFLLGILAMETGMKNQAISAKVAEYQVDKITGEVTFVWLTPKSL